MNARTAAGVGVALGTAAVGALSFRYVSEQQAVNMKNLTKLPRRPELAEEGALRQQQTEGVNRMLAGLQSKSAREKLETAHDAATRTHEIGFKTDESAGRAK